MKRRLALIWLTIALASILAVSPAGAARPSTGLNSPATAPTAVVANPRVQAMIGQVTAGDAYQHDRELAGELPVWVDGGWYTISTRDSYSGTPIQKATHYVGQYMQGLGLNVEYQVWDVDSNPNVIGELLGSASPGNVFIIGSHLDDVQGTPGADDNASGAVATMIAAEILSQYEWGCTLRFAFWTGEEDNLWGSDEYAYRAWLDDENILGYLNLDMIAYNATGSSPGIDLLYNPDMPATQALAQLFAGVVDAYDLSLVPQILPDYDWASDHASFWEYDYPAILAIEDEDDFNPWYHGPGDTPARLNQPYFVELVKASIATMAHMNGCLLAPTYTEKVYIPLIVKSRRFVR